LNVPQSTLLKSRVAGADRAPKNGARFDDINPAT
jgi:hypothetical protein